MEQKSYYLGLYQIVIFQNDYITKKSVSWYKETVIMPYSYSYLAYTTYKHNNI